jgi:hypothetical protein
MRYRPSDETRESELRDELIDGSLASRAGDGLVVDCCCAYVAPVRAKISPIAALIVVKAFKLLSDGR